MTQATEEAFYKLWIVVLLFRYLYELIFIKLYFYVGIKSVVISYYVCMYVCMYVVIIISISIG